MEDRLWSIVVHVMPADKPAGRQSFASREILLVMAWAALHDRPIRWACQAENWPPAHRLPRLPHPSTVSRRRRQAGVQSLLRRWHAELVARLMAGKARGICVIDGMPLRISDFTKDPDARNGHAYRHWGRGYKLHAVLDPEGVVLGFEICPLNVNERVPAVRLLLAAERYARRALADGNYDGKPLHRSLEGRSIKLYTPLIRNEAGPRTHPRRLWLKRLMTKPIAARLRQARDQIERQFGLFGNVGFGFKGLPNWVRRLHRVTDWMSLKVLLYHTYKLNPSPTG
jgi:hypothetical protein